MNLKILLPYKIFLDASKVSRITVETNGGSYGLLPRRLDCVAVLTPGILSYHTEREGEVYIAVDEGVLVKTGAEVRVSARRAFVGVDLHHLRDVVAQEFLDLDEHEKNTRQIIAKLESGLLRRFANFNSPF